MLITKVENLNFVERIWLERTVEEKLRRYVDSDWAGSAVDIKSTACYCFTLGS